MSTDRRAFLGLAAAGIATTWIASSSPVRARAPREFKAIAFDAFAIFDARPIAALAEQLFPGKGAELSNAWRTRQFEYQWLRALTGRYADFWHATEDALMFACDLLKLELTLDKRKQLMDAHLALKAWPDVPSALKSLQALGLRIAVLSNATPKMLDASIENSALKGVFERVLSTDAIQSYKPDPRAYRMAIDAFGLKREDILFVAFAGWDAAGSKAFGYSTFWANRMNLPAERLGDAPDAVGKDLDDLVPFVKASR
jgi:2-haloacid dehalogenase